MFRRNILPLSSESKKNPLKLAQLPAFLLGLLFDREDRGKMFLRNVGLSPNYIWRYNPEAWNRNSSDRAADVACLQRAARTVRAMLWVQSV
jgi:hypothetical protein